MAPRARQSHDKQKDSEFFFSITPERVLEAVEESGVRCTGRVLSLYAMENRVYEAEVECDEPQSVSDNFRVVKFYRPHRWSKKQLEEEHQFLLDLVAADIPVIAPVKLRSGKTVGTIEGIHFAVFPRCGGRSPDDLQPEEMQQLGRLLARVHIVGAQREAKHRPVLSADRWLREPADRLLSEAVVPEELAPRYAEVTEQLAQYADEALPDLAFQRIHGDCHPQNVLRNSNGFFLVDFDDMMVGPPVQDIWLLLPGRDHAAHDLRDYLLTGYEEMRHFDRSTLRHTELLRAMRLVYFTGWIHRRWNDPAFPRAFPQFGTPGYWNEHLRDLMEQRALIERNDGD